MCALVFLEPISCGSGTEDLVSLLDHVTIELRKEWNVEEHRENQETIETETHIDSIWKSQFPLTSCPHHRQRDKEEQHLALKQSTHGRTE